MQTHLKKGRTFSKPQEKLNRIYELLEDDCVCCFCGSYLFDEIAKVVEWGDHSQEKQSKRTQDSISKRSEYSKGQRELQGLIDLVKALRYNIQKNEESGWVK